MVFPLIKKIKRNIANIPGWRTKRKIVVFESDDWGSIRMPSRFVFEQLLKQGIRVDNLPYNRFDALASEKDLTALFEVLHSVKDKNGRPAIITANTIVANPDFKKIEKSNYQKYNYEPFTETLKRYPEHENSFKLWEVGIRAGVFKPQFHGREHLNVTRWLKALRNNTGQIRTAFGFQMFDLSESENISENSYMEALNFESPVEFEFQKQSIIEGTQLFENLFGFRSKTFIAPCYIWSSKLNETLLQNGIEAFQGNWLQFEPKAGPDHRFRKIFHYTGERNKFGQVYLTRNASFEPSQIKNCDWNSDILSRMEIAFRWGKPAIIGTHRLNFIGYIDPMNREVNLSLFSSLLKEIVKKWPDVEFMSSDDLADFILRGKSN